MNLTLNGTTSGLRSKSNVSRAGLIECVRYDNVRICGSKRPIDLGSAYDKHALGTLVPQCCDIVFDTCIATPDA